MKEKLIHSLHIFILINLAVAPLYELTTKFADFYVAHDSSAADIFLLVFLVSFILPGALAIILALVERVSAATGRYLHFITIGALV
ncbi:MAG: hypothetical protein V3V95_06125, partial [Thermodesulfobacteriota bacterium]